MALASMVFALPGVARARDVTRESRQHVQRAHAQAASGELDGAIAELEAAVALTPQPALLVELAELYARKGDRAHALELYRRVAASAPEASPERAQAAQALAAMAAEDQRAADEAAHATAQRAEDDRLATREAQAARTRSEAQQKQEAQRAQSATALREAREREDAENAALRTQARARAQVHERRRLGWTLLAPGLGMLAGAGVFIALSSSLDDEVRGGFMHATQYQDVQARGQIYNGFAWTLGVAGVLSVAVGLPLVLTAEPDAAGVAVTGQW